MENWDEYFTANKEWWNQLTGVHVNSEFYNVPAFLRGQSTLNNIESDLLGNVRGKKVLHLQCHFGLDSLSLAREGALVTGVDLSDQAIHQAEKLAHSAGLTARFLCCNLYDLPGRIDDQFDLVFTSYGVIGWLPDLDRWASVIAHFLRPGGRLIFAEFHPVVWMFDDEFREIAYSYFNRETIAEDSQGSYTDRNAPVRHRSFSWNHDLAEVLGALFKQGLQLESFQEFDYSPYNCFRNTCLTEDGFYQIEPLAGKIPMVYALSARKNASV